MGALLHDVRMAERIWVGPARAVLQPSDLTTVFFEYAGHWRFRRGSHSRAVVQHAGVLRFLGFAAVPLIVELLWLPQDFFKLLGVLSLLFLIINMASARISNHRIKQQIRLEYENRQRLDYLKAEKERAERANEVKTRFLAAASHDLRQPLNAIGRLPWMRRMPAHPPSGNAPDRGQPEAVDAQPEGAAQFHARHLQAGRGRGVAHLADFSLQLLLDQLALEFGPEAANKGLALRIRPYDVWVRSDPIMLTRVLRNLLSNAIRYTPSGGVLLGCRRRARTIRIEVHDTGPGIPAAETSRSSRSSTSATIRNATATRDSAWGSRS